MFLHAETVTTHAIRRVPHLALSESHFWRNLCASAFLALDSIGGKLGIVFARGGHEVVFSYSRNRKKLEATG